MFAVLQIAAILLVAIAMALALAHALEFPGKLRLEKDTYLAVQAIYYPGFTFGGFAEILALVASLALVIVMPFGTAESWLAIGSLVALAAMNAVYWVFTHPVNNFWLKDTTVGGAGAKFFSTGAMNNGDGGQAKADWTALRDRWEYSHVARAALGVLALILLAAAVTA